MAEAEEVATPQLGKEGLACLLMHAMFAAKNLRDQRDRLVQLRRRLQQRDGDGDVAVAQEVASGLHKVCFEGLHAGTRYLTSGLKITQEHGARNSFSITAFAVIPDDQLYGVLHSQWLPPRPATQADAFARVESAFYAVNLAEEHHVPRCIELLVGVRPPPVKAKPLGSVIGYSDDPVRGVNEHLAKNGLPEPMAPAAAAATGKESSVVDLDQALSYLHRASSLTSLAVKHIDIAVAAISSWIDPEEVADTAEWVADISEVCS
jgi:hypothetical protein